MWRTEIQEVKEEFQLIQFRLLYSNAGDFAETPVSTHGFIKQENFAIVRLFAYDIIFSVSCFFRSATKHTNSRYKTFEDSLKVTTCSFSFPDCLKLKYFVCKQPS